LKSLTSFFDQHLIFHERRLWIAALIIVSLGTSLLFLFPVSSYTLKGEISATSYEEICYSFRPDVDYEFDGQFSFSYLSNIIDFKSLVTEKLENSINANFSFFVSYFGFSSILFKEFQNTSVNGNLWYFPNDCLEIYLNQFLTKDSKIPSSSNEVLILSSNGTSPSFQIGETVVVKRKYETGNFSGNFIISGILNITKFEEYKSSLTYQDIQLYQTLIPIQCIFNLAQNDEYQIFSKDIFVKDHLENFSTEKISTFAKFSFSFDQEWFATQDLISVGKELNTFMDQINQTLILQGWRNIFIDSNTLDILINANQQFRGAIPAILLNELPAVLLSIICFLGSSYILKRRTLSNFALAINKGMTIRYAIKKTILEYILFCFSSYVIGILNGIIIYFLVFPRGIKFSVFPNILSHFFINNSNILVMLFLIHSTLVFLFDSQRVKARFELFFDQSKILQRMKYNNVPPYRIIKISSFFLLIGINLIVTFFLLQINSIISLSDLEETLIFAYLGFILTCITFPLFGVKILFTFMSIIETLFRKVRNKVLILGSYSLRAISGSQIIFFVLLMVFTGSLVSNIFLLNTINKTRINMALFELGADGVVSTHSDDLIPLVNFFQANSTNYGIESSVVTICLDWPLDSSPSFRFLGINDIDLFIETAYFPSYIDLSMKKSELIDSINQNELLLQVNDLKRLGIKNNEILNLQFQYSESRSFEISLKVAGSFKVWPNFFPDEPQYVDNDPIDIICSSSLLENLANETGSVSGLEYRINLKMKEETFDRYSVQLSKDLATIFQKTIYFANSEREQFLPSNHLLIWVAMINYLFIIGAIAIFIITIFFQQFILLNEKQGEIGIHLTLGLDSNSMLFVMLTEGALISLFSQILGLIGGSLVTLSLVELLFWKEQGVPPQYSLDINLIAIALIFSVLVTEISYIIFYKRLMKHYPSELLIEHT